MALNPISLSHHLIKKSVSSLLILKKKKRNWGIKRAPEHGRVWGYKCVIAEDPSAHLTTWRGEFWGKLVCYLLILAPVQSTSHFYHLEIIRKNDYGSSHSRNRDSGSSCVTLGRPLNLSGLPAYSCVSQYVHLVTPHILQPTAILQSTFTHFSAFDSCNNPVE